MTTSEDTFTGTKRRTIYWRSQLPDGTPKAVVVIAHGFGEHSGRYRHVADHLVADGYAVYLLDHHGHGRSEGPRGRISLAEAVEDLDHLAKLAASGHPGLGVFLLGHSMGGAISLRYCMLHSDRLAGLILSGPLAEVEGREAVKVIGKLIGTLAPNLPLTKLDPGLVSRDPDVVAAYVADPLVFHKPIPAGTVAEFVRHVDSLPTDCTTITLPTLLMWGTEDKLAAPSGSVMLSKRLGAKDLTATAYEGLYHEILNEPEQAKVLDQITSWLGAHVPASVA